MPKKILLADDSITIQKVVELTFSDGDYDERNQRENFGAGHRRRASDKLFLCFQHDAGRRFYQCRNDKFER